MNTHELISKLQERFGSAIVSAKPDAIDPYVIVEPARIVDVCIYLRDESACKFEILNDLSGTDYLEIDPKKVAKAGFDPHLEVVYHLSSFSQPGARFTLKVILPRDQSEVPTVSSVWRTADWHERECFDLFGVRFSGHSDLRRILLNDDWVGHPMLKDYEFPIEYHEIRCR